MINLIFISFINSLDMFLCMWKKHQHIVFNLEDMSEISSAIYKIYHLWLCIMNQWNHFLEFIQSFITVDCNVQDSQILLDRSVLKNFKINIYNDIDSWKFEWKFQITEIFSHKFVKKIISTVHIFEVWTAYRSCLDNNNNKVNFWNVKSISLNDFTNMSKKLCQKYYNFFNIWNADWLAFY